MTASLILMVLWAVSANLVALLPTRLSPRRGFWLLVAAGIPLVGLVTSQHGPWVGMLVLAAGIMLLRWPLPRLLRRARDGLQRQEG